MAVPAVLRVRVAWVDGLRGLAIVLMFVDHALAVVDGDHLLRFTVTRFSLPLFMLCAAVSWRPASRRRIWILSLAAVAEMVLLSLTGIAQPGILALFLWLTLALTIWPALAERPYPLLVLGLVQALYLPIDWHGYQPGLVLCWWAAGRMTWGIEPTPIGVGQRVSGWPGLAYLGRHPLPAYLGHLLLLVPVALVVGAR